MRLNTKTNKLSIDKTERAALAKASDVAAALVRVADGKLRDAAQFARESLAKLANELPKEE